MSPHEQNLIDLICPAIQSKSLIRFWYLSNTTGIRDWRTVEPHIIGSFPRKHIQLSAWFIPTDEQAQVGQKSDWRTYHLKNMSDLQILDKKFISARPGFDPKGGGMDKIYCVVPIEKQAAMQISR